jgi:hypothetical protein
VSDAGDHVPEMPATPLLGDLAIEAIVDDRPVAAELRHLAAFAAGARAAGDGPAPQPSPALARLLARPADVEPGPAAVPAGAGVRRPAGRRRALAKVAGLGLAAKIGISATAAAAGVTGAGAAGVLPGGANRVVRDAIEVVTPVEFSDHADRRGTDPAPPADGHGDRTSSDATGESDGVPGVDGPEISEDAPGASVRPTVPPGRDGTPGPPADVPPDVRPHGEPDRPAVPGPPADPGAPASTVPTPTPTPTPSSTVPAQPSTATGGAPDLLHDPAAARDDAPAPEPPADTPAP